VRLQAAKKDADAAKAKKGDAAPTKPKANVAVSLCIDSDDDGDVLA
jgi:hypothetical protein